MSLFINHLHLAIHQKLSLGLGRSSAAGNNPFLFQMCIKLRHGIQKGSHLLRCDEKVRHIASTPGHTVDKALPGHIPQIVIGIA